MECLELNQVYKHFKGGTYLVIGVEDGVVVYEQLYASEGKPIGTIHRRSLKEFLGMKILEDGTEIRRFELIAG